MDIAYMINYVRDLTPDDLDEMINQYEVLKDIDFTNSYVRMKLITDGVHDSASVALICAVSEKYRRMLVGNNEQIDRLLEICKDGNEPSDTPNVWSLRWSKAVLKPFNNIFNLIEYDTPIEIFSMISGILPSDIYDRVRAISDYLFRCESKSHVFKDSQHQDVLEEYNLFNELETIFEFPDIFYNV